MKIYKKCLAIQAGLMLFFSLATAQTNTPNVINASGKSYVNSKLNFSWSVGEIAIQTFSNTDGLLTQGLLQPEPIVVSGIQGEIVGAGKLIIFPNPFTSQIQVVPGSYLTMNLAIYSINGQKVYENPSFNGGTIHLETLMPGIYFLSVYDHNEKNITSIKLIKL